MRQHRGADDAGQVTVPPSVKVGDARARWTFVATFRTQRRTAIHGDGRGRGSGASRGGGAADYPHGGRPTGRGRPATAIAAARAALTPRGSVIRKRSVRDRCGGESRTYAECHGVAVDPARIVSRPVRLPASFSRFWTPSMPAIVSPSRARGIRLIATCCRRSVARRWRSRRARPRAVRCPRPRFLPRIGAAAQGRRCGSPPSERHHDDGGGARRAGAWAEGDGIVVISDEIYHGLDYAVVADTALAFVGCRRHQFVLEIFLHDRMADRVDGGAP